MTTRLPPIMRESQWLESPHEFLLLEYLKGKIGARKGRLFACACARLIYPSLLDDRSRRAVELAERYADGLVADPDRQSAAAAAAEAESTAPSRELARCAMFTLADEPLIRHSSTLADNTSVIVSKTRDTASPVSAPMLADLIRHIFGNPFQPSGPPGSWPSTVVQLAQAVYDGQGDRLVLADALEEAGHTELANHFRNEPAHPKGCWALDLVVGKQ